MTEGLEIEGRVERSLIILTVSYGKELLLETGAGRSFSEEIVRCYRTLRDTQAGHPEVPVCLVEIKSEVAGSPLVRALYELWQEVVKKGNGQVICIDYPEDYIDTLTSLGLPSLGGFTLFPTTESAVEGALDWLKESK